MGKLSSAAQRTTQGSEVMANHTKWSQDQLIEAFPGGVTISAVDILSGKNGEPYPVFNIEERHDVFVNGGTCMMSIVNEWMRINNGDLSAVNADLKDEAVRLRFYKGKTKTGNNIVRIEVL